MRLRPAPLIIALPLLGAVQTCHAWGEEGHAIVAEIAQRRLDFRAAAMVSELLGPGVSLASVASWADDYRSTHHETANWHFVDIPRASAYYEEARDCADSPAGDCVIKELARVRSTLACSINRDARRDALRFGVHFVGDVHQPLHAVKEQLGANLVTVQGTIKGATCNTKCELGAYDSQNLHMVWDTTLIRRTVFDWGAYVERLENGWLKSDAARAHLEGDTPVSWANHAHAQVALIWNDKLVPADGTLTEAYYTSVLPILDEQLGLAGLRLADFLNEVASAGCNTPH